MKKIILLMAALLFSFYSNCQTLGNINFSVTPTSTGGYSPKHVIAIWIETGSGTFVKTKLKYAASQNGRLISWNAASGGNVVDAITGATQSSYTTYTGAWNATDVSANVVPDGVYKVQFELAWGNNSSTQRSTTTVTFTKGPGADHQTGNTANFTNIVIDWIPSGIGILENNPLNPDISVFPNPFSEFSTLSYTVKKAGLVYAAIYDINGKVIKNLFNDFQSDGEYSLKWNGNDNQDLKVSNGVYYVTFQINNKIYTKKILFNR
jgi:flagellar hook assembly protein FlgD